MSEKQTFIGWVDERFPLTKVWNEHLAQYYAPRNFNFIVRLLSRALFANHADRVVGGGGLIENIPTFFEGRDQIRLDIVVERLQWRNIKNAGMPDGCLSGDQLIESPQKCRQRLAATRRSGNKEVAPGRDCGP